jgi:hypothetical protein
VLNSDQQKELNNNKSKLKTLIKDKKSGFSDSQVEGCALIMHNDRIYVLHTLHGCTLEWYHYYLNHPGRDRLANT